MTRPEAITALLDLPDEPTLKRGHVLTIDGKPDRFDQWRTLPMRYVVITRASRDQERTA